MIKMQKFSFSGAGKPFDAKLQINITPELFLVSINTHIVKYIMLLVDHLEFT